MIKDINNIDPKALQEDERITSYLKGQMPEEEASQFLKELEENPELKEKAVITARMVKGLKEIGAEQDRNIENAFLASTEESVERISKEATRLESAAAIAEERTGTHYRKVSGETTERPTFTIRKTSKWMSIAASIFFVVWLGVEYSAYRSTTGLGKEYYSAFPTEMVVRDADLSSETIKKLDNLFGNVQNGDNLEETIHSLSLCWELSTMDTYNDYTDYSAEIGWNLAIAHLKDNNKKDARKVLEQLIAKQEEGSAISKKAKELLEKL